jgi:hypothetical protein
MSEMEQIEIARYRKEINQDLLHMIGKYSRIMGWEVPELDEQVARTMILQVIKESLAETEAEKSI